MTKLFEKFCNQIFQRDVLEVLRELPDESVDMVYGDPDYGVGINYSGAKYEQKWNKYISWYGELARESLRVLRSDGNLFLLNYPRQNAHLRVKFLEDLAHDVFEYVWVYPTNVGHTPRRFTTAHRSILHVTKSKDNRFYKEQVAQPYKNPEDPRIRQRLADGSSGRMPYSWFEFNLVKNISRDKTFHACQIPIALFEMLLLASTKEGDSAFVLFGGSGSELVKTKEMKRVFVSCELHPEYHKMILERLNSDGAIAEKYKLECARPRARKQSGPVQPGWDFDTEPLFAEASKRSSRS